MQRLNDIVPPSLDVTEKKIVKNDIVFKNCDIFFLTFLLFILFIPFHQKMLNCQENYLVLYN